MPSLFEEAKWIKADDSIELYNCPNHTSFTLIYGRIYTVGQGFSFSDTNNFISNLKIKPSETHRNHHKKKAIDTFVSELTAYLQSQIAGRAMALIPIPPSKSATHPEYDDRIEQVAKGIEKAIESVRCWPVLKCVKDRESLHAGTSRSTDTVYATLDIDGTALANSKEDEILCLLDDVLTSGASFSACRQKLLEQFPGRTVMGIFWAKAQYPEQFEDDEF
ncbi:MAG: hypothetical protein AAGC93_21595 [Cyanobacteria bacterium P01_F01_bin.53]